MLQPASEAAIDSEDMFFTSAFLEDLEIPTYFSHLALIPVRRILES